MIKIYHNKRCSKSKEAIKLLEEKNIPFETIYYLEDSFTKTTLLNLIRKLHIQPIELIRTKEKIWIENYKNKSLTNDEILEAMLQFPQLIERPIVENETFAVVARPVEKLLSIV